MLGGHSNAKPADDDAKGVADSVREHVQQQLGRNFGTFEVQSYTTQVVAGLNYNLKVLVDNEECLHLKVYKPLPHTGQPPQLSSCDAGKTLQDPL